MPDVPGAAAAGGAAAESGPQVAPEIQGILDSLSPLPASVLNERFDLLAWNAPYAALWPSMTGAAPARRIPGWPGPTSLGVLATPSTRIVVYTPADETCRAAIDQLLAGKDADARFPCWPQHARLAERGTVPGPAGAR